MPDANDEVIVRVTTPQDETPRLPADQMLPPGRTTRMTIGEILALGATDGDAIHDNVANEIGAIAAKATPLGDDILVIEDQADSGAKKQVELSTLPWRTGYGLVVMGADQSADLAAGDHVEFSGFNGEAREIAVSSGAGQANGLITLQPGIWRMECWLRGFFSGPTGGFEFQFRDNAATAVFGVGGRLEPQTGAANQHTVAACHAMEEFLVATEIEVRILFNSLLTELEESSNFGCRATFTRVDDGR